MSGWLSHRSNYSQSSQIRISEPISNRRFKAAVTRTLGMGAQIVRTPTDAMVPTNYDQEEEDEDVFDLAPRFSTDTGRTEYCAASPPRPLPPVATSRPLHRHNTPPKPNREPPLPPTPETSPLRPALKVALPTALSPVELPPLPNFRPISGFTVNSMPSGVATAILQPPPPFSPVLVAPCYTPDLPPTQILVQLETASSSLCTTMHTLTAISSRLSEYLSALVPAGPSPSPPPSPTSPFSSAFQAHQEAMGLRTTTSDQKPPRMHIFLDRPSTPYIHILAFLRSITASSRPTLPRGLLQMPASSAARMEALFELRDEARYLGMTILEKLCEEEISRRQAERSARHGHGSAASEDVNVSSTEAEHSSNGPVPVPNATERVPSSSSRTSSEVGAAGAAAKQRRLYIHGSKSAEGVYTGSLGSRGGLGSRSVEYIPRNVFTPEPTTPMRNIDPSIPTSDINAVVGIGGAVPIRPLGLASRRRSSSVTRPLPPLSPGGRI
ncbi:hypothetical protein BS47DRAFT_1358472 [Hydnum rufescens UP504]|uniref:Uncharacterized protein n=1 Tax=Hydnum rufescens UP504 TaxID=1448309 RepID=A0A9P6B7Z0_9AGAM|nr:hypothetical protein BS47DRAFT_1358472 [Hydnum rufescens UP504]